MKTYKIWKSKDKYDWRPPKHTKIHKTIKGPMTGFGEFIEQRPHKSGEIYWVHEEGTLLYRRVDLEEREGVIWRQYNYSVRLPPDIDADCSGFGTMKWPD